MKDTWIIIKGLLALSILAGGAYGWVWNIIKLVQSDFIITSGMSIGRVIGVFVLPVGSILGFM